MRTSQSAWQLRVREAKTDLKKMSSDMKFSNANQIDDAIKQLEFKLTTESMLVHFPSFLVSWG